MQSVGFWAVLRAAVISVNIFAFLRIAEPRSNLDWGAGVLMGAIAGAGLYWWLTVTMRLRSDIDWSKPFSLTRPFWPMQKFPLRFWLLAAYTLMSGGLAMVAGDILYGRGREGVGGSFFVTGLLLAVTLVLWIWVAGRRTHEAEHSWRSWP